MRVNQDKPPGVRTVVAFACPAAGLTTALGSSLRGRGLRPGAGRVAKGLRNWREVVRKDKTWSPIRRNEDLGAGQEGERTDLEARARSPGAYHAIQIVGALS